MKRILVLMVILLLVGGAAVIVQLRYQPLSKQTKSESNGILTLTNLPAQFCPIKAELVTFQGEQKDLVGQNSINLANCRYFDLKVYLQGLNGEVEVYIKVSKALAFKLRLDLPLNSAYRYPLSIGDIDDNNVIDANDEKIVTNRLFKEDGIDLGDLDGDGFVSMIDISLIRINKGVGEERPDGISWIESDL